MMSLPRSTPEAEGIPSSAILDFLRAADARLDSLHSLMVVRHGRVVAEGWWSPYSAGHPHMMFSVSKSFTSLAIGIAIDEGLLALDDRVVDLLPDDLPAEVDPHLAALTVRHLLTMTTGHATDTVALSDSSHGDNWAAAILAQPLEHAPGTHYVYNSGATHVLSAIMQRLTGQRLLDYLRPRLLEPLGITDATWETSPQGIDAGGWGLSITSEQLALFGQLLLQRGQWDGRRLVPADWIDEATSPQVDTSTTDHDLDGRQGYGYQFWRNRLAGYRADGAFGQFCIVLPEQDAVVVLTSALPVAQLALDLVWEHLLPAFGDSALPPVASPVQGELAALALPAIVGERATPRAQRIAGIRIPFDQATVTAMSVEPGVLTVEDGEALTVLEFGSGEWVESAGGRVWASGGWVSPDTLVVRAYDVVTPYSRTVSLAFDGESVTLDIAQNVAFGDLPHTHAVSRALP
ncbi:serine hydrolase domain-containing protein [Lacisediminihabitans sp. FW035]